MFLKNNYKKKKKFSQLKCLQNVLLDKFTSLLLIYFVASGTEIHHLLSHMQQQSLSCVSVSTY